MEEVLDYVQYNPKKLVRQLETWVTKSVKQGRISLEEGRSSFPTTARDFMVILIWNEHERETHHHQSGRQNRRGRRLAPPTAGSFTAVEGHKILVHGGGRSATKVAAQLGIESQMINGRRVTDADMLNVVTMVYGGLVKQNIVYAFRHKVSTP